MAKSDNILGVEQIELGAPGDGVMGASLTPFTNVEVNSVNLSGATASNESIPTEDEDAYLTIGTSSEPTSMTFRLYEVFGDDLVLLMGGSYDSMNTTFNAPKAVADTYLSVRLTSKAISGFKMQLEMPYAKIDARHEGSITKSALLAVEVTATANTPVASGGAEGAPYSLVKVAV
jgi:hypothetical protein